MPISQEKQRKIKQARNANCTELDLSNDFYTGDADKLTEIPSEIFELTHLQKLNLSGNKINYLPSGISKLENLTSLDLSSNQLKNLPDTIGSLSNLIELKLSLNQLEKLPDTIGQLSSLRKLFLDYNQLFYLPEKIVDLDSSVQINLKNNDLQKPPIEITNQGINQIRRYFENLKKGKEKQIYEAKLIIIGEPLSGKTSLAKKISYKRRYKLNPQEAQTQGVNIFPWSFSRDDKNYKVNIWDFGGQEIQHAAHKFFLTKRSLYILVVNTRRDNDRSRIPYWLETVRLFSLNSPTLIVKNEQDDNICDIGERLLKKDFSDNLKEVVSINLGTDRGLKDLETIIKNNIQQLPIVKMVLPENWLKVRQELKKMRDQGRPYIQHGEYVELCNKNKINNNEQLISDFNDLGFCLYYKEGILGNHIILDPEWLTNALYKLLLNQEIIKANGSFKEEDLSEIWGDTKYENMQFQLLKIMVNFKFCYEIRDKPRHYIIPQLLSEHQPDYKWNDLNNLTVVVKYDELMPRDIINGFIVSMNLDIEDQQYVWKNGVILSKYDTRAEIIQSYQKKKIIIRVDGENKQKWMTIILNELNKLNDYYEDLNITLQIPCNCQQCSVSGKPHPFDLNMIERFVNKGKFKYPCPESTEDIDLLKLTFQSFDLATLTDILSSKKDDKIDSENSLSNTVNNLLNISMNNPNYNQYAKHSGSGDIIGRDKVTNYNYAQDLTQAAEDIQRLLNQLDSSYSTDTLKGKTDLAYAVVDEIQKNPNLWERILHALQAGGIKGLEKLLDHPAATFVVGALEDFKKTKPDNSK